MDQPLEQMVSDLALDIEALSTTITQGNPNFREIQQVFLALQQRFQNQVLPTATAADDLQLEIQPLLTEMNRTLRLLGMDVAFLQTARQSMKQQQRQRQMGDRLTQLHSFCQGLQQRLGNTEA